MINLAQLIDGSAEELTVEALKKLYQEADSDGDAIAMELILKELKVRE